MLWVHRVVYRDANTVHRITVSEDEPESAAQISGDDSKRRRGIHRYIASCIGLILTQDPYRQIGW